MVKDGLLFAPTNAISVAVNSLRGTIMKMKLAALLLAGTGLMTSTALAADPVSEYNHDWSGVYVGLGGGGVWGNERASTGCGVVTDINDQEGDSYENLCAAGDAGAYYEAYIGDGQDDGPNAGPDPAMVLGLDYDDEEDEFTEAIAFISEELQSETGGWFGGAQLGLNHQSNSFVFGVELGAYKFSGLHNEYTAEFDYFQDTDDGSQVMDDYEATGVVGFNSQLDWLTKATARAGMAFMDEGQGLAYVTGGFAAAHVSASAESVFNDPTDENSDGTCGDCSVKNHGEDFIQFGFVVGGGLEYALTRSISVGAEYNFIKLYGGQTLTSDYTASDGAVWTYEYEAGYDNIHMAGVKLNYKFD